jgi:adenylyltransferase/sulfurtransferase
MSDQAPTRGADTLQREIELVEARLISLKAQLERCERGADEDRPVSSPGLRQGIFKDLETTGTGLLTGRPIEDGTIESDESTTIKPGSQQTPVDTGSHYARPLDAAEYSRYSRQLILPEIGLSGQLRLKAAKILVIGIGGLGCPAATYLAGAGVGTMGLMDGDTVEASNLHRQVAHSTSTCGEHKVDSAAKYLLAYVYDRSSQIQVSSQSLTICCVG